jgi:hypothetical protein
MCQPVLTTHVALLLLLSILPLPLLLQNMKKVLQRQLKAALPDAVVACTGGRTVAAPTAAVLAQGRASWATATCTSIPTQIISICLQIVWARGVETALKHAGSVGHTVYCGYCIALIISTAFYGQLAAQFVC